MPAEHARDDSTQTSGHVMLGEQGEVIIAQNVLQVQLIISDAVMQRLHDCRHDVEQLTDLTVSSLARLNWNGERILHRAMTAFKLKVAQDMMPQLLQSVTEVLRNEQVAHRVEHLVQQLFDAFQIRLFGIDIESLVFILEHHSVDDAELMLRSSQDSLRRQRELQKMMLTCVSEELELSTIIWSVGRYSLTEVDRRLLGGLMDSSRVVLTLRLAGEETEVSKALWGDREFRGKTVLETEIPQDAHSGRKDQLQKDDDADSKPLAGPLGASLAAAAAAAADGGGGGGGRGGFDDVEEELRGMTVPELENQRNKAIQMLCDICGADDGGRPLRILFLGPQGVGKSSLFNSIAAALSEDGWHEYAYTGLIPEAAPITIVIQDGPKCFSSEIERYRHVLLPTLTDVPGLSDENNTALEKLLWLLIHGHVEEDDAVMAVYMDCQNLSLEELQRRYSSSRPATRRVDRVVFVTTPLSAVPHRLITCLRRALSLPPTPRALKRFVPVFGVMTHKDQIDVTSAAFLEQKKEFIRSLGLQPADVLVCTNYCDDVDPEVKRVEGFLPDLDIPILRFMLRLCAPLPHLSGKHSDTEEEVSGQTPLNEASSSSEHPNRSRLTRLHRLYERSETTVLLTIAVLIALSPIAAAALLLAVVILRLLLLSALSPS